MSTVQKRILSSFYWLAGLPLVLIGAVTGFVWCATRAGFRLAIQMHDHARDIWDAAYNEPSGEK